MTDEQLAEYERRIEPIRDTYLRELHRLEAEAARAIDHVLSDLRGLVHPSPIEYVERRFSATLDARLKRLDAQYQADAARIRREVGIE